MAIYGHYILDWSFIYSSGEQISTLEEAVSLCDELDLIVFLDVKPFKTEKVLIAHTRHFNLIPCIRCSLVCQCLSHSWHCHAVRRI